MNVHLRPATTNDVSALLELYRHLFSHDVPSPPVEQLTATWELFVTNPAMTCLIAEVGSTPVGTCCLIIVPNLTRGGRPYALVENVVVHSQYQKMGVGRQMVTHAIAKAREANCYKVMLLSG